MKDIWNSIQMAFTAIGGFFGWFLGGVDGFLHVLLVFVVIDYITGVMCAIYDHDLSSEIGFKGISQKVLIFLMVGLGTLLDSYILGDSYALITKRLLEAGLITKDEYNKITAKNRESFSPLLGRIMPKLT